MATEVVRYVDPDAAGAGTGLNWTDAYTSLSSWNTAEATNLVTADKYHTVHCRSSAGTADITTPVIIVDWTTDATHYITIIGDDFPTNGVLDETKYRLTGTNVEGLINVRENYIRIGDIQGIATHTGTVGVVGIVIPSIAAGGSDIRIDSCIIKGICSGTSYGYGIEVADSDAAVKIFNCVIYDFISGSTATFRGIHNALAATVDIYNCTISGCYCGIYRSTGTVTAKNCAVFNNTDDFNGTMTIDYCASDDGDGTNAQDFTAEATDWNKVFTDYTTGDVSLIDYTTSPCCIGVGTNDPSSGLYSDDIIGTSRTSIWDIGAFEYTAGGGGARIGLMKGLMSSGLLDGGLIQ